MDNHTQSVRTSGETLSRGELANRWHCSISSIKRRESEGLIKGLRLSSRLVRYRLSDIEQAEREAMS